jgi:hypothetical protein
MTTKNTPIFIRLNGIFGERRVTPAATPAPEATQEPTGEDDGIESNVHQLPSVQAQPEAMQIEEDVQPMLINVAQIRNMYPRRPSGRTGQDRVGTRIMMVGGIAQPVTETMDQVQALIEQATA